MHSRARGVTVSYRFRASSSRFFLLSFASIPHTRVIRAIVVFEQSSEPCAFYDFTCIPVGFHLRFDDPVIDALMGPLHVVMHHVFGDGFAQRILAEKDDMVEAFPFDCLHETLRVTVHHRHVNRQAPRGCACTAEEVTELLGEERIAVVNQILLAVQEPVEGVGQVASDLHHEGSRILATDVCDLDLARKHIDHEVDAEHGQALQRPDWHEEEVGGGDLLGMDAHELFPRHTASPLGRRQCLPYGALRRWLMC